MASRKIVPLSENLELAVLHAIVKRVAPANVVRGEELSKLGRVVHKAVVALETPSPEGIVLHAIEVQGVPRSAIVPYVDAVMRVGSYTDANDILRAVRDKQTLVDVINAANEQLGKGALDVTLLRGLLDPEATSLPSDLVSIGDRVEQEGIPDPPKGFALRSLPTLAEAIGGVFGMLAIGGEPGLGKSTLGWQIILDITKNYEIPALVYDIENGYSVIMDRVASIFNHDPGKMGAATRRIYHRDSVRSLDRDLAGIPPPAVVAVDSIQKVSGAIEFKRASLDRWVHRLELLKKRGYTVMLISEVGRAHYNSDAYIGSFKETGEIEYSADVGLQILPAGDDIAELHIVKNRHRPKKGMCCLLQRRGWTWRELGTREDID